MRAINRALAQRNDGPVLIETGGQNAMIVADALAAPDAVLVAIRDDRLAEIRRRFATSEGPIVPVLAR